MATRRRKVIRDVNSGKLKTLRPWGGVLTNVGPKPILVSIILLLLTYLSHELCTIHGGCMRFTLIRLPSMSHPDVFPDSKSWNRDFMQGNSDEIQQSGLQNATLSESESSHAESTFSEKQFPESSFPEVRNEIGSNVEATAYSTEYGSNSSHQQATSASTSQPTFVNSVEEVETHTGGVHFPVTGFRDHGRWCECPRNQSSAVESQELTAGIVEEFECSREEGRDVGFLKYWEAQRIYKRNMWRRKDWLQTEAGGEKMLKLHRTLEYFGSPVYPCFGERRFGNWSNDGQWVCRPQTLNESSVVYSIHVTSGYKFEEHLHHSTGAAIHVFTPKLLLDELPDWLTWHSLPKTQSFESGQKWRPANGERSYGSLVLERSVAAMQQIRHRRVNVLKVDCHSCDAASLRGAVEAASGDGEPVDQVLLQFYWQHNPSTMVDTFEALEQMGYRAFHAEKSFTCRRCLKLAYVHKTVVNSRF